jgi:hypothetical protein
MKSRIRNLNRQTPRGHLGWLCVANNGDCLGDSLGHTQPRAVLDEYPGMD